MKQDRESIWSVAWRTRNLYFVLFIIQFSVGIILIAYQEVFHNNADSLIETLIAIWQGSAPIAITSASNALVVAESGRLLMVLAHGLEEYLTKKREKQLAAARAEERERWVTWNEQRKIAEAEGREPPPPPSPNGSDV